MPMAVFSSRFLTSICVMAVFSRNVPNSAAAVCCCWILVLQIPELSPKMAVCKRFASPGPLNSAQRMHAAIQPGDHRSDPSELPLELDSELADVPDALIRKLRIGIRKPG
jgi:hypothetical protein